MNARNKLNRRSRARGAALIFVTVSFVVLMAFLGLSVDLARAQTAKTELRRAADAAARAACETYLLTSSESSAQTAATDVMNQAYVDGELMNTTALFNASTDVIFGNWSTTKHTFTSVAKGGSPINAVQVFAYRITSRKTELNLFFSGAIGRHTVDVWTYATAAYVNVADLVSNATIDPQTVKGNYDPYLAGAADFNYKDPQAGTYASAPELPNPNTQYDTIADGDTGKTDLFHNSSSNFGNLSDHKYEYDVAGPVGGTVTGTGELSESPLQVQTSSGGDLPIQGGDVLQISVPASYQGQQNLVSNDNDTKPVTDANGTINGQGTTTSAQWQDVGAIPPNDTTTFDQYAAYDTDPQANYTGNPSTAAKTNMTDSTVIPGTENYMSNVQAPLNSLLGVFLGGTDGQAPVNLGDKTPPGYDFGTETGNTNREYTNVQPQVQQVFYAGSGTNSGNIQQSIVVPSGATRFFLGTMDGQEWSNNSGQFAGITITQYRVILVQ